MVRLMLGLLLIGAAVCFLLFSAIPALTEDSQFVLDIMQPVYCNAGEKLSAERVVQNGTDGTVSMSAIYTCSGDGQTHEATTKAIVISAVGFVVPLLIGIVMIILASQQMARNLSGTGGMMDGASINTSGSLPAMPASPSQNFPFNSPPPASDLTGKLAQLKDAYDRQLISSEEYERKRAEIMRQF